MKLHLRLFVMLFFSYIMPFITRGFVNVFVLFRAELIIVFCKLANLGTLTTFYCVVQVVSLFYNHTFRTIKITFDKYVIKNNNSFAKGFPFCFVTFMWLMKSSNYVVDKHSNEEQVAPCLSRFFMNYICEHTEHQQKIVIILMHHFTFNWDLKNSRRDSECCKLILQKL